MGGERLFDPARVLFAFDHYAPPSTAKTAAFHDRVRAFARRHGAEVCDVGEGISFQLLAERGGVLPGDLVIGADSHTVTCGALNLFATGVGSSDLAAAMITGQVWLRVPGDDQGHADRRPRHRRRQPGRTSRSRSWRDRSGRRELPGARVPRPRARRVHARGAAGDQQPRRRDGRQGGDLSRRTTRRDAYLAGSRNAAVLRR